MSRRAELPRNVRLLGLTSLINDVASEMIFPLLPVFVEQVLKAGKSTLGVMEGVADATASLLKLFSGGWSDRAQNRKGFLIFGYGLAIFARPLMALATHPWHVVATRAADRAGKGIRTAPRDALIVESTPPGLRGRAFGFHRAMDHLGAAIGPVLAWFFLRMWPENVRMLFALSLLPGLVILPILIFGVREQRSLAPAGPRERFTPSLAPFDRRFRLYLIALAVFTLGNSTDAFLLARASDLGLDAALLPVLWMVFHVCKSFGNVYGGRGVDRFGARPLLLAGWLWYATIYGGFALVSDVRGVWILFPLYAVYYALAEPAEKALAAELAGDAGKGLAFGWCNFAIGVTALPASLLAGVLYDYYGAAAAFGTGSALALAACTILMLIRRIEHHTA
jgi:MFS family permease